MREMPSKLTTQMKGCMIIYMYWSKQTSLTISVDVAVPGEYLRLILWVQIIITVGCGDCFLNPASLGLG